MMQEKLNRQNLKSPNGKIRNNIRNTISDAYYNYDNKYDIDFNTFRKVCKTFNHLVMKSIIDTGNWYNIPNRLGHLQVKKFKIKGNKKWINWNETQKYNKIIFFEHKHSDGWVAKFNWDVTSPKAYFGNKSQFRWKPVRYYKSELSKAIKQKNTINKYYEF